MMKRIIAALLCLALLLSFAACSAPEGKKKKGDEEEDIASLAATELYARAADTMPLLPSYELETAVTGDVENVTWITRRVRAGYDQISFSRTKKDSVEGVYFDGETAWIVTPEGGFCAPATTVTFQSFWEGEGYPVCGLDMEHFVRIERDGMTVTYGEGDEEALAIYANLADFTITGIEGKAVIGETLYIEEEEITVTGTGTDGSAKSITIRTKTLSHGEKDFSVASVPDDVNVMQVSDIRLPGVLQAAESALFNGDNVALTLVTEESASGVARSVGGSFDMVDGAYSLRQSVYVTAPEVEPVSTVTHILAEKGTLRYAVFNGTTGEAISDESAEAAGSKATLAETGLSFAVAGADALADFVPRLSSFATAEMEEEVSDYTVKFTLNGDSVEKLIKETVAHLGLEEGALKKDGLTVSGTLTISKKDGVVTAMFYELSRENETPVSRISFTVSYGEANLAAVTAPTGDELH